MMTVCICPLFATRQGQRRCRLYGNLRVSTRSPAAFPPCRYAEFAGRLTWVKVRRGPAGHAAICLRGRIRRSRRPPRNGRSSGAIAPLADSVAPARHRGWHNLTDLGVSSMPTTWRDMAQEMLGLTASRLRALARHCGDAADLLERRLEACGLSAKELAQTAPAELHNKAMYVNDLPEQGALRPRSRRRSCRPGVAAVLPERSRRSWSSRGPPSSDNRCLP